MRYCYSALYYLLIPLLVLRLFWRSREEPAYRQRLAERFGRVPVLSPGRCIWVHAVSVGETLAAIPLVEALLRDHADHSVLLTTSTPTGSQQVIARFGDRVLHCYAPMDTPGAVQRFLRRIRPKLLILMETELWPNTIHYCRRSGCRVLLANARLSERSCRGYSRLPALVTPMLTQLDRVACQATEDARRFESLGLPESALVISGTIKYDVLPGPAERDRAQQLVELYQAANRLILLAASTHPGEDELVLAAYALAREQIPDLLLILAPRHPRRCASVMALCRREGWRVDFRSCRDSNGATLDIEVVDTMGELALLQSLASLVIVGGSLVPHGGQNPLEAAAWGAPLLCGPHMYNFAEVARQLLQAGAMEQIDRASLGARVTELLLEPEARRQMGEAASRVSAEGAGALRVLRPIVAELLAG